MRELHLFAGIGGGILAGEMLGHRPVCAVEVSPFCREILHRHWPELPLHDDIKTFDGTKWRGAVDVVAGGFPCQDISSAGKGAGLAGAKSSLWFEMLRVVRDVEPRYVFVENSPMLRTRGLDRILGGLASLGFDAAWEVVSAADVGACHLRRRMWILAAHPDCNGEHDVPVDAEVEVAPELVANTKSQRRREGWAEPAGQQGRSGVTFGGGAVVAAPIGRRFAAEWWQAEPNVGRVADGVPSRVDRLRALGNAQVPAQAAEAFRRLRAALDVT